ncbi:SGNH/GDSL hydrolase family protein [Microbacterium gubbeenense]|uniref:SGNH/GDSL hydrolase family protein n=1 Tax=Microbacterium gubbeenense TaxID=159896 RepID=UPI003F9664DB
MRAMTGPLPLTEPVRYVAVGDSFTEGIGDGQDPGMLGWADRVADGLRAWSSATVSYANLAIRGRTISGVLSQIPTALSLHPAPCTLHPRSRRCAGAATTCSDLASPWPPSWSRCARHLPRSPPPGLAPC